MSTQQQSHSRLATALHKALKLWHKDSAASTPLAELALYQNAGLQAQSIRQATNRVLLQGLEVLELDHPEDAKLLRDRFIDRRKVYAVANSLNVSQTTLYEYQRAALLNLGKVVEKLEVQATHQQSRAIEARLPLPTYSHLIGVDLHLAHLQSVLLTAGAPWIVALEGIGGIGKTSLADALVRQTMRTGVFRDVAWISAQRTFFDAGGVLQSHTEPALTTAAFLERVGTQLLGATFSTKAMSPEAAFEAIYTHISTNTTLLVVDNLETMLDIDVLLPMLRRLTNPSKVILTSREHLPLQADLSGFDVPQLSESVAFTLLRQEATYTRQNNLVQASDKELRFVYETVGGNPLALRLVVGQSYYHGLAAILEDLAAARGAKIENLYTHIYRQAWDKLEEQTRAVFVAMPLVSDVGGDIALLQATTKLELDILRPALEHLVTLNLVDARDGPFTRRYSIHNLTRTFLQRQILKWHL